MFCGEYKNTIDSKGRIIIPAKFREELGEKFVVTKGLDNCLYGYSLEEWSNFEKKVKELPQTDKYVRTFTRFFFSGATECELDKQGRVLIPSNLREYAKLEKNVYTVGVSSRFEIWAKDAWEEYISSENIDTDEIASKMAMLGI